MSSTKAESLIVDKILAYVREHGGKAIKVHGSPLQSRGEPDVLGGFSGQPFAVEVKVPGEQATPLQLARLAEWHRIGHVTGVVTSLDEFKRLVGRD